MEHRRLTYARIVLEYQASQPWFLSGYSVECWTMAEVTVAAAKPRFHFVVTSRNDSQKQRRRHEETADGAARSHAARISHSHRRSSINTDTRKWLVLKQSPRRAEKPQGPLAYVAVSTSYSSLDPFVELSLALSAQERNLVHCCESTNALLRERILTLQT